MVESFWAMDLKLCFSSGSFQCMQVSRDHTGQKWKVLVQTFILQMWKFWPRAKADLPKVSGSV